MIGATVSTIRCGNAINQTHTISKAFADIHLVEPMSLAASMVSKLIFLKRDVFEAGKKMDKYQVLSLKCQLSHAKIISGAYKYEKYKVPVTGEMAGWGADDREATDEEKLKIEIKKMTDCIKEMESMMRDDK